MRNLGLILVTAGLLVAHNAMALDGTIYPVVTFECNTAENTLKIKSEVKWDDEGRNFKYSAADGYLLARLEDGEAIQLSLPQGWIPPASGKHIRVKRITRLFFGERFVLLKDQ